MNTISNPCDDSKSFWFLQHVPTMNAVIYNNLFLINNSVAKWRLDAQDILELPILATQHQDGHCSDGWQNLTTQP